LVDQVPFFSDGEPDFVSEVLQRLSFEVFLPGELVIKVSCFCKQQSIFTNHLEQEWASNLARGPLWEGRDQWRAI